MSPETKAYDQKMIKTIEVVKANFASVRAGRANAPVCWTASWWNTMAPPPPSTRWLPFPPPIPVP